MTGLKPCPFCGAAAELMYQNHQPTQCSICFACGPDPETAGFPCDLSMTWNTRTESESLRAEVARLLLALTELDKAASVVSSRGAQTGPQWSKLAIASLRARAALAHAEADQ